jgi:hypothetical protein
MALVSRSKARTSAANCSTFNRKASPFSDRPPSEITPLTALWLSVIEESSLKPPAFSNTF